jgi:hypothetical protein
MTHESFHPRPGALVPGAGQVRELPRTGGKPIPAGPPIRREAQEDRVSDKLKALVELDVEGSQARITIRGSVDTRNVKAVYVLAKRANSIVGGLDIVLDFRGATVQPKAMEQLRECSKARQLPRRVDPDQAECRLRITPAAKLAQTPVGLTLVA